MAFKLADEVLHRIVQIFQEAMLGGWDASDGMRQIEVIESGNDEHKLILTPEYKEQVKEMHKKMLSDIEDLKRRSSERPSPIES